MSKIVEKNGLVTETFYGTEKGVVQERKIDHKPILEHNKELYDQNDGYSPDKGLKRIASIPTIILEIWAKNIMVIKTKVIGLLYQKMFKLKF